MDFSSYSVNFVTLASHALVESSIFFGDTFKFKLCMCDSERLLGRFAIFAGDSGDSGDLVRVVTMVENDLWNLTNLCNYQYFRELETLEN